MLSNDIFRYEFTLPDTIASWTADHVFFGSVSPIDRHPGYADTRIYGFEIEIAWRLNSSHMNRFEFSYALDLTDDDIKWRRYSGENGPGYRAMPRSVASRAEVAAAWVACDVQYHLSGFKKEIAQYMAIQSLWDLKLGKLASYTTSKRTDLSKLEKRVDQTLSMLHQMYPYEDHPHPIPAMLPETGLRI